VGKWLVIMIFFTTIHCSPWRVDSEGIYEVCGKMMADQSSSFSETEFWRIICCSSSTSGGRGACANSAELVFRNSRSQFRTPRGEFGIVGKISVTVPIQCAAPSGHCSCTWRATIQGVFLGVL